MVQGKSSSGRAHRGEKHGEHGEGGGAHAVAPRATRRANSTAPTAARGFLDALGPSPWAVTRSEDTSDEGASSAALGGGIEHSCPVTERVAWGSGEAPRARLAIPPPRRLLVQSERYEELGVLGRGGVGEVIRVRDRELGRVVALKVLQPGNDRNEALVARFLEEARITAQLEHPGIVPVHDVGRLPDGRAFFTMKEVQGRGLDELIRDLHEREGGDGAFPSMRLIDVLHRVATAVAYAHARGVIHRDLKPHNVMVGSFGEVTVLDWGLACVVDRRERSSGERLLSQHGGASELADDRAAPPLSWPSSDPGARRAGTLAYMSLEQAMGDVERIGPATDVYALGALLFHVLTGEPPYRVGDRRELVRLLLAGDRPSPSELLRRRVQQGARRAPVPAIPAELEAICQRALALEPDDRYRGAAELAAELAAFRQGERCREQALARVVEADMLLPAIDALREKVDALRAEAAERLAGLPARAGASDKEAAWALEDEANAIERSIEELDVQCELILTSALADVPDLREAKQRLADRARKAHERAERERDARGMASAEARLRAWDQGDHEDYLEGEGALTLVTAPGGAEVSIHRYVERGRRLVLEPFRALLLTPLCSVPLPRGSYLVELRRRGCVPVRYPVSIGRNEHWDSVRPGETEPSPVYLPRTGDLDADEVYVPAGPFVAGGDAQAVNAVSQRRLWVHGFALSRTPVSHEQYLAFLNDLIAQGREELALAHAPRTDSPADGELGALLYALDARGFFTLPTSEGRALGLRA
jgi:serine/threonine protein kinase/formylglycine-generating enzyme required for sulfatase activity